MGCQHVKLPGGGSAIVCGATRRCGCGNRADLLCDWKVPAKKSGTCDKPLCARCTHKPRADKDLCPKHADEWKSRSK
jgi:hypothetical protein